jgi:hypothetical protein
MRYYYDTAQTVQLIDATVTPLSSYMAHTQITQCAYMTISNHLSFLATGLEALLLLLLPLLLLFGILLALALVDRPVALRVVAVSVSNDTTSALSSSEPSLSSLDISGTLALACDLELLLLPLLAAAVLLLPATTSLAFAVHFDARL